MKSLSHTVLVVVIGAGILAMQGCVIGPENQGIDTAPLDLPEGTAPAEHEDLVINMPIAIEPEVNLDWVPEDLSDRVEPFEATQVFQPRIERDRLQPGGIDAVFDADTSDDDVLDVDEPSITIVDPAEDLGPVQSYVSDEQGETPVYMIGVERTPTNRTGRAWATRLGHAEVHIEAQDGPFILVLSGRSPVEWHLTGPGVADIERLVTLGLRDHRIVAADLEVEPESPRPNFRRREHQSLLPLHWWPADDQVCDGEDFFPYTPEGIANERICEARRIQTAIDEFLGAPVDIFAGTEMASEFIIQ